MNKRIKELAVQARQYAWVNETHWSANAEREALFEEKFAELIVRECIDIARDEEGHSPFEGPVETKIKQHFGVEEK